MIKYFKVDDECCRTFYRWDTRKNILELSTPQEFPNWLKSAMFLTTEQLLNGYGSRIFEISELEFKKIITVIELEK